LPDIDESKFARVTVEFASGTPAMTFWCSRIAMEPEVVRLQMDVDGEVKPLTEIRRAGLCRLVVDFDAQPDS
jgi:hypothetical protein